jgi:hypothetical protein
VPAGSVFIRGRAVRARRVRVLPWLLLFQYRETSQPETLSVLTRRCGIP